MDLKNMDLLSLLPLFMRNDKTAQAMVNATQPVLLDLGQQSKNSLIFPRLDELNGDIVDELAWERHVDFYDPALPLDIKRELVRRSEEIHWYKGTLYAVQATAETFYNNAKVREWFEYGGEPYTFWIDIQGGLKNPQVYLSLLYAIEQVKNKRSWFRGVSFNIRHNSSISVGVIAGVAHSRSYHHAPYVATKHGHAVILTGGATRTYRYRKYKSAYIEFAGTGGITS